MDVYVCLLTMFLTLQLAAALPKEIPPVPGDLAKPSDTVQEKQLIGKIRSKRKLDGDVLAPTKEALKSVESLKEEKSPSLPSLPTADVPAPQKEEGAKKLTTPDNKDLKPEHAGEAPEAERVKKQACVKVPCGSKTVCGSPAGESASERSDHPEVMIIKHDDSITPAVMGAKMMTKSGRTIEPIYSFGPVSVHGGLGAYGSSAYARPSAAGVSSFASPMPYAAPGMPYPYPVSYGMMPHRHHVLQHSLTMTRGGPVEYKPEVVYYDAPEPVYVEAEEHDVRSPQPMSLYCQTVKSKDLAKALQPEPVSQEKVNNTVDESTVQDHIERVNQIKDEITQLNQAAQRIVDQQERLARMQEEHIAAVSAKTADPYVAHQQRYRQEMRTPPYGYGYGMGYMRPPYYRDNEEEVSRHGGNYRREPSEVKSSAPVEEAKKAEAPPKARDEAMEQPPPPSPYDQREVFYPSYGGYYGYRAEPGYGSAFYRGEPAYGSSIYRSEPPAPLLRSETGFPVSSMLFKSNANVANYPTNSEDTKFFMRMLDMGKRMGVLSQDFQPSVIAPVNMKKEADDSRKSESLLDELVGGGGSSTPKGDKEDEPSKVDMIAPQQDPQPAVSSRKDRRGLVLKKA